MNTRLSLLAAAGLGLFALGAGAADWPQWLGPDRDARAAGFKAPKTWPKELTKKWSVTVGLGDASPAVVGDRVYVFTRQGGDEVTLCLNAADGSEVWRDKYPAEPPTRPADRHPGPRSSPAVADGKIVTLGVRGTLSCLDTARGKKVWRKDDVKGWPQFFTSSSPLIVDGLCVAQLGGSKGAVVAYELVSGNEKWKWEGSTAYASPVLLNTGGTRAVVAETSRSVVGIEVGNGKLLWEVPFPIAGRMAYNASTPVVEGQTIYFSGSGRGTHAVKVEKKDDGFGTKELWSNKEASVQFNTPVVTHGLVIGITARNQLFCLDAKDGKTAWTAPAPAGGGGRRGGGGFGSVVAAGPVVMALTPAAQLVVFEANPKEYKELAKYKVADSETYAYPVVAGNRIFIKDRDSLTLWTVE